MRGRRLISVLSVGLLASATVVGAQPKKGADKKEPAKPKDAKDTKDAKDAKASGGAAAGAAASAGSEGSGSAAGSGSAVEMKEDAPPADMEGRDENPGAPRGATIETEVVTKAAPKPKPVGYPMEEVLRPINMPKGMSEVSLGPHAQVSPGAGADALRARYGINEKIQLGLTYLFAGIYDDPASPAMVDDSLGIHGGKAVGLDLTIMLNDMVGVRAALPMYISPFALAVQVGVPLKIVIHEKYAFGGFDDLLTIKAKAFPPTFYQEVVNAAAADGARMNTIESRGSLRLSTFGIYQYRPKTALVARLGLNAEDFSTKDNGIGGLTTFARVGFDFVIRKSLDLGFSLGFDDLAHVGSFGPAGLLNFRI